jgi:nucleotide-binding universal stress UspA family protein
MISKIICPFDFSNTAYNGAEYAAKLATAMEMEILFINVREIDPVTAAISMGHGLAGGDIDEDLRVDKALDTLCASVKRTFHVPADYQLASSMSSFVNVLRSLALDSSMIVIGSNGADTLFQQLFGSNSYNLVRKSLCPVLIVPEDTAFRSISKVVLAWDYDENGLKEVIEFLKPVDPQFTFVHVQQKREKYDFEKVKQLLALVRGLAGTDVSVELLSNGDFASAIEGYMDASNGDLLVVPHHSKGPLSSFNLHQHTRSLVEKCRSPLLIMPRAS